LATTSVVDVLLGHLILNWNSWTVNVNCMVVLVPRKHAESKQ
jgi:hypothetical protein